MPEGNAVTHMPDRRDDISNKTELKVISVQFLLVILVALSPLAITWGAWGKEIENNTKGREQAAAEVKDIKKDVGDIKTDVAVIKATQAEQAKNIERILSALEKQESRN